MSGPRDLRRGSKPYEKPDPASAIGQKNHFICERFVGFAITIRRRGQPVERIYCATEAEMNRQRRELSDAGLIGVNGGAL